ncbi:MAG: helix-turn-helix domain-containing protein [Desulfobacteraceae bacterium]|nr:helix-turn-helix domain-containing protein [Desulfobacteraceae bacterium]
MNEDARTLPAAAQEEKRNQAVRLHKKDMSYREISEVVGVTQLTVGKWIRKYKADGSVSLKSRTRGRPQGVGRWLDADQQPSA